MNILVVEDEPKAGNYLLNGLQELGHCVSLARDGVDGLHQALETPFGTLDRDGAVAVARAIARNPDIGLLEVRDARRLNDQQRKDLQQLRAGGHNPAASVNFPLAAGDADADRRFGAVCANLADHRQRGFAKPDELVDLAGTKRPGAAEEVYGFQQRGLATGVWANNKIETGARLQGEG